MKTVFLSAPFSHVSSIRHNWGLLVHAADPMRSDGLPSAARLRIDDVRRVVAQAAVQGVLPAVARSLRRSFDGVAGLAPAMDEANGRLRLLAAHSFMLRGFAEALLSDLKDQPVTLVKGLTFARHIYPQPQLRPFTDIDLMVAPSSKSRVAEVLTAHGFVFADETHDPERREDKWLHRDNAALLVEIHTNMVHAPSLQDTLTLSYDDLASVGPDRPAAFLMVATMHAALHQFERLRQVVDIVQAARSLTGPAEEQQFAAFVARTGGRLVALAGLDLAWRMFGEPRCREIASGIGSVRYRRLARLLMSPSVVLSMTTGQRPYYTWRRQGFRELLKRGGSLPRTPETSH